MATDPEQPEPVADPQQQPVASAVRPVRLLGLDVIWWAIAVTALCFLPLGLVAVAYCLRATAAADRGEQARALRSLHVARRWVVAAIVVGLVVDLLILAVLLLLGAFAR